MEVMDLRIDQALMPQQWTVISHRQIMAVRLLQMPSQELAAAIAREREDNPAFESDERTTCHYCGAALESLRRPCPVCGMFSSENEHSREVTADTSDYIPGFSNQYADDGTDPMMRVAAHTGRGEGLLQMLCASIPTDDATIAEYLVASLDHHGYLPPAIVDDAAQMLACETARVEGVLRALQSMEPAGIGARGAQECLLIQLRQLREAGQAKPLAELLVRDHLHALASRHFREVAHRVGATPKLIEGEWQFIREHLHPYPTHGFDEDFGDIAEVAMHIRPDVVIRRGESGRLVAEVVERQQYDLRVNREYLWAREHISQLGCNEGERRHVRRYVEQAQSFIAALRQRWDTMQRVSDALIDLQRDFLERGQSALKPLTRADVAKRVQLHESTVSRATDGKFVLLPNGRTIPFDEFFDSSLPVKKVLGEIIATENPSHPFSDEQLAHLLMKRGFLVARRTIAKYREEVGILPSRLRRRRIAPQRVTKALAVSAVR